MRCPRRRHAHASRAGSKTEMTLTDEDRRRLKALIENAMAEVDAAAESDATIRPDDGLSLMDAYDWGRDFILRMDVEQ